MQSGHVADGAKLCQATEGETLTVNISSAQQLDFSDAWILPSSHLEKRWYAAYTRANHEKRVAQQLVEREVDHFLPLYSSVRRWKDRRVQLDLPLFPGYVFVRLALRERLRVLQVPSIARLVGFGGLPVALSEAEIKMLNQTSSHFALAEPHPYLTVGKRVRIIRGAFEGLEGLLLKRKKGFRVVLSINSIARSVIADVDLTDVMPIA
jgi:transcription antitermination factor NusG